MSRLPILLVEDDEAIAVGLARALEANGYAVRRVADGAGALAGGPAAALVLLDLGLPDIDGLEVCRRLRERDPALPIVILTARDQELDVVAGLDAGADDYLVKPFRLSELLARVRAHVRRAAAAAPADDEVIVAGELRVDMGARRAWQGPRELSLRPRELELLALLAREQGRVVTRERIMREVWDTEWLGSTKTLDTHMTNLRRALGGEAITTLRGVGYRLEAP